MSDNNKKIAPYIIAAVSIIGFIALVIAAMFNGWVSF